MFKKSLFYPK